MYAARWITVLFLILVTVVPYIPQAREEASHAWEGVRPALLEGMDTLYATIRNFVAGSNWNDGIDDSPPGVNFDIIITMARGVVL